MTDLSTYVMTEAEAHRVTEDIRHNAKSFTEYRARLMEAVERAKAGSAHVALGYKSWTAYLSEVLGEEPMRLARAERQDMVRMLSDEGMSTRAIAPIVGVQQPAVVKDLAKSRQVIPAESPEPAPANVDPETGEILDEPEFDEFSHEHEDLYTADLLPGSERTPAPAASKVTGMDGKQYTRPEPHKPRRKALSDIIDPKLEQVWSLSLELADAVNDDRFSANREALTERTLNRARATAVSITDFLAALDLESAAGTEEVRERILTDLTYISDTCQRLARSL